MFRFRFVWIAVCSLALAAAPRPLTHQDYDSWRNIQNQRLSPDGKYVGYALFPQAGDGEFVVRELATKKEFRQPIGARPAPPPVNFSSAAAEDAPPPVPAINVAFSSDSRTVVFSAFPPKADVDKAKREKKKADEMPRNGMVILDLASGKADRIENVKGFQVPEDGSGVMAFLQFPAALVLRNLSSATDRTFPEVSEFSLSKNARLLVFAVASKTETSNGVFTVATSGDAAPAALLSGPGKYSKLTWDEPQLRLAFLSSHDDVAAKPAKFRVWMWAGSAVASPVVSEQTAGFRAGLAVSEQAPLNFSKDGKQLFFGSAPVKAAVAKSNALPDDLASFDLWHYKDDYIQPMQKVRAQAERTRSYRAVYSLASKTVVQLTDETMPEITFSEDGTGAFGFDDRGYRSMREYDETFADSYLIDTATGARMAIGRKQTGRPVWSPDGRHALWFSGKDWTCIGVPDGRITNLTSALHVKFWQEEHDTPNTAPAWGTAGWTKDGSHVLLYDRYDVWVVKADGTGARNLTAGEGRKQQIAFRYVNLNPDPKDRGLDPAQPLLLRAENMLTHDTGFYKTTFSGAAAPVKLLMEAKEFSPPVKAKNADVLLLTAGSFQQFPDLQITDSSFTNLQRVSDANPQQADLLWGSSELFRYRNVDGVKLDAALYKPANFDPAKKYPMIVYIYERLAQNVHHFVPPAPGHNINISYYTSNGYIVITPDIAYTIGYPGQSAQKCVLAAVEEMVNRGFVDENAIGIQGHSWGGYQIAYMITRTNRFRAAAAGAPVADMISAYDGVRWGPGLPRQFQYERTQSRIGGTLWEYPLRFIENSPIFMADRVSTPLLMIHNDADDAVPWYQGIEYYLALRRLGKEVYMFSYNGEPHGLRRRPNQKDYTTRLQEYFDYYLKGAAKPAWMERGIPFVDKAAAAATDTAN
jgi:dipeptidyl aminopeptidase/acylaminoacyl peptidase